MINKLTEYWYMLVAAVTALGGAIKWWHGHKENVRREETARLQAELDKANADAESSAVLFEALEVLKKKVIASVLREVAMTNKIAEKDVLIEGLRLHCPECYVTFMVKLKAKDDEPQDS